MANLRIAELDFDQIKTNLKAYLNSQTEFVDYDFEGSGLAVLIDLLAYNTHYNAYLANMVVNEMFLDSAVKRASAVSIAKHLGYTPRSVRGAKANLDITVNNPTGLPATLTLSRYTAFSTTINSVVYTFLTNTAKTATRAGTEYTFTDVDVIEGVLQEYTHTVSGTTPSFKYEIPDVSVDTTTLQVTVQTSATDTTTTVYNLATDITGLTGASEVFFLEQNPQGRYQVYFGDGYIGKALTTGNLVKLKYIVSSGAGANVSGNITQTFTSPSGISGSSDIVITVNSNSTGGAEAESISSIKFNAPLINTAKNRLVTAADYKAYITSQVSEVQSVSVWGGEQNDPPIYGKVLIALKPYEGFVISDTLKSYIIDGILADKKVLSITPEFVDPEYLYVLLNLSVSYRPSLTTLSPDSIKSLINAKVIEYFDVNLSTFESTLYPAQFIKTLLESNSSIINVSHEIKLQKRIVPILNIANTYSDNTVIKFYNKIHPNEISSTNFYASVGGTQTLVYLQDKADTNPPNYDGTGTLGLYNSSTNILVENVGTVNYGTGEVTITGITPTGYTTGQTNIQLTATLQLESGTISSLRNQILTLDTSAFDANAGRQNGIEITVNAVA